ncbi:MAG TPA: hypothetical protein ENN60_02370 [archaeon]|nr:hypothetical protein [archaeon]
MSDAEKWGEAQKTELPVVLKTGGEKLSVYLDLPVKIEDLTQSPLREADIKVKVGEEGKVLAEWKVRYSPTTTYRDIFNFNIIKMNKDVVNNVNKYRKDRKLNSLKENEIQSEIIRSFHNSYREVVLERST